MHEPTGRTEDRNFSLPSPGSLRLPDEEAIDWGDGTMWFISWLDDHDAYHAERWYDPDEFDADDADAIARLRDCPGPEEGVFASLDVVEAAMGERLPGDVRTRLQREAAANPSSCRDEWGVVFACQVMHLLADGAIVTTWAPAWADDPLDHKWDLDCCGPPPDLNAAHRPHLAGG